MEFEWDPDKANRNYQKHGVFFSDAATIFGDANAITIFDEDHSDEEDRFISVGRTVKGFVLVVSFTCRVTAGHELVRIISAREADKDEELQYYEGEVQP
jgi:uncharacterized DUF497 family protein